MPTPPDGKKKKTGPKSDFSEALGPGVNETRRFPPRIHTLLKESPIKRLLNWMEMVPTFKQKILDQVPDEPPPEP